MEEVVAATDVTIYLVPPNEQGTNVVARKRPRHDSPEQTLGQSLEPPVMPLGEIHADSSRLRQCSRYFDACMSERWTMSSCTQQEFYLEAHTEVKFYHDCFARMHSPLMRAMSSITACIQLLKVASQIQYEEVMENGLRYLASIPWSEQEETQIRAFYSSCHNVSTSDLSKRLQERQEELQRFIHRAMSFALQTMCAEPLATTSKARKQSQTVFLEAFKTIMTGERRCKLALPITVALIIEESEKILVSVKKGCQDVPPQAGARAMWAHQTILLNNLGRFGWLFCIVRSASSAQAMVELLLKDPELPPLVQAKLQAVAANLRRKSMEEKRWAKMMATIFQDVLEGRLFLRTAERLELFTRWNWLLKVDNFEPNAPFNPALVANFIMGFPHEDQEEIFRCWASNLDDPAHQGDCDLSEAHILWIKHLIAKAERSGSGYGLDFGSFR